MKEKLLNIINYYGVNHQQRKLAEEVFELQEAITEYGFYYSDYPDSQIREARQHITEEIADVMVLLNQFAFHYDIKLEEINKVMSFKVNRQLERIKNGE